MPGSLSRLDPVTGQIRVYGGPEGLTSERVFGSFLDQDDGLWVSTGGGLFRSTPVSATVRFERPLPPGTDDSEEFYRYLRDSQGRLRTRSKPPEGRRSTPPCLRGSTPSR